MLGEGPFGVELAPRHRHFPRPEWKTLLCCRTALISRVPVTVRNVGIRVESMLCDSPSDKLRLGLKNRARQPWAKPALTRWFGPGLTVLSQRLWGQARGHARQSL
jgi:hypothetical protein